MKYDVGYKFGNIEVIKVEYLREKNKYDIYCKCLLCEKIIKQSSSNMSKLKGLGCRDCVNKQKSKNAVKHTRLYNVWKQIKHRCQCSETDFGHWKNYSGRGITICKEWEDYKLFKNWAENNGWNENNTYTSNRNCLTIDRIDNNKGYCPENCRVITHKEQQWNKRCNVKIDYNGETFNLLELSKKLNVSIAALYSRYKRNKPLDLPYKTRKSSKIKEKKK